MSAQRGLVGGPLPPPALARWLLENGLLAPRDVVDGEVRMIDASRSHAVTLVSLADGGGLAVKQADPVRAGGDRRLAREVVVYAMADTTPALAAAIPACNVARGTDLLVLDLVNGESFNTRAMRLGGFESELGAALGATMASWHAATRGRAVSGLPATLPWILNILEPPMAGNVDPSFTVALQLVPRRDEVRGALEAAAAMYRYECLIHGDIRWENCLVSESPSGPHVKVVDWELADFGDPAWDIGGAMQEHIVAMSLGWVPAASVQASARAMWAGYLSAAGGNAVMTADLWERTFLFAGARLLQSALEHARQAGPEAPTVARLFETGADLLLAPDAAAGFGNKGAA